MSFVKINMGKNGKQSFHQKVVEIIKKIPRGKVATYGLIAALAGSPRAARQVVRALHASSRKEKLPWHRVINSQGKIGLKPGEGYELQRQLLLDEGVIFRENDSVDLDIYLWSRES
ncbi:MAG: MGMT family protein [Candidatus Zixiibacteriota bacterium]